MKSTTPIYAIANDFAQFTQTPIFITGNAGTGKTTFLRKLKSSTQKQMAVVAPTGIAAINAGGVTIHSFFQLPFTPFVPTPEGEQNLMGKIKMTSMRRKVLQELELLVIDEISMVRADLLDEIDTVLRHIRYRRNTPFGGVQVIFIGDLYQLPPVVTPDVWETLATFYEGPYFFNSRVIQKQPPTYIEFDTIFRQEDSHFIKLLNEVRVNRISAESLELLQSRYNPDYKIDSNDNSILLTTHNAKAERINNEELAKIDAPTHTFKAEITGEFPEKNYPNEATLILKEGAKVMFIANDPGYPRRYFNGKIGTISRIDEESRVFVECEDMAEEIPVSLELWENVRYTVNKTTKQIEETLLGSYSQLPLRLAWAITIHKSQGLTFDKAVIDAEAAFSSGQTYVALSRCRTLEGVTLLSPIHQSCLFVAEQVKSYSNNRKGIQELETQLDKEKEHYNQKLLLSLFDFTCCKGLAGQVYENVEKDKLFFSAETVPYLLNIYQEISSLDHVANLFQKQLNTLIANEDTEMLKSRLEDSAIYFTDNIEAILTKMRASQVATDSRDAANTFNDIFQSLFGELARQKHLISKIHEDYSAAKIFALKKSFRQPRFEVNAYQNHTPSTSSEKRESKSKGKTKSEKSPKLPTSEITYNMYKSGMSIEEIAAKRDFTVGTIEKHLERYVKSGDLPLKEFVPEEIIETVKELFLAGETLSSIFNTMEGNLTFGQLRMIRATIPELEESDAS